MSQQQSTRQNNSENREEHTRPAETSILFESYAKWVLAAFLLIAIWYRFVPLIAVGTFLLLLSIIIDVWGKKSLLHIKPALHLSKSRLFAGEEFLIHASVHNDKWLPLIWFEWNFPKMKGIILGDNEQETYLIRFLWLLWFQRVEWTLNGKAVQRGVYNVGQVTLRSGDGFRFTETQQIHRLDGKVYVYPKLISVFGPAFKPSMQWGAKGRKGGFIEDPLLVSEVREYQPGDELRKLNWRASARTGKLQTNLYQPVVIRQLVIYIDVQGFVINETEYEDPVKQQAYSAKKQESFEGFLSIIASAAVKYKGQGIYIGFASNALNYVGKRMSGILPNTNLTPFLDQLAQITQRVGVQKMAALDEMLYGERLSGSPLIIFCEYVTKNHYMWYQQHKHKLSDVRFYYRRETEYGEKLTGIAKPMDTFVSSSGLSGKGL